MEKVVNTTQNLAELENKVELIVKIKTYIQVLCEKDILPEIVRVKLLSGLDYMLNQTYSIMDFGKRERVIKTNISALNKIKELAQDVMMDPKNIKVDLYIAKEVEMLEKLVEYNLKNLNGEITEEFLDQLMQAQLKVDEWIEEQKDK